MFACIEVNELLGMLRGEESFGSSGKTKVYKKNRYGINI